MVILALLSVIHMCMLQTTLNNQSLQIATVVKSTVQNSALHTLVNFFNAYLFHSIGFRLMQHQLISTKTPNIDMRSAVKNSFLVKLSIACSSKALRRRSLQHVKIARYKVFSQISIYLHMHTAT